MLHFVLGHHQSADSGRLARCLIDIDDRPAQSHVGVGHIVVCDRAGAIYRITYAKPDASGEE